MIRLKGKKNNANRTIPPFVPFVFIMRFVRFVLPAASNPQPAKGRP